MKSVALLCALLAANLHVPAAEKLAGGPFVVNVGPRSATLVWIVETGEATLGTGPGKADKTAPVLRAEKVAYTGLQPGTSYYYDVRGLDEGRGSFKTAQRGSADFQFAVYADTRTRHDMHRRVIGAVLKRTENFVSVKVTGKSAHIEAFGLDGSVLDRIDLKP